ncbi:hypothetical protein Ddc_03506 [Ditylenchus destructor]|nr:hypothetical protein Ddc_03506 [Ditylenchus destructor]
MGKDNNGKQRKRKSSTEVARELAEKFSQSIPTPKVRVNLPTSCYYCTYALPPMEDRLVLFDRVYCLRCREHFNVQRFALAQFGSGPMTYSLSSADALLYLEF